MNYLSIPKGAKGLFAAFLRDPSGVRPRPRVIDPATATFRQGAGSRNRFSAKPA